jgi:hypothetical protein
MDQVYGSPSATIAGEVDGPATLDG